MYDTVEANKPTGAQATTHRRILIIDDETDLCMLLSAFFVRRGYEVCVSHTIGEGFELARTWHPTDIFLDHNLPDGTGWGRAPEIASFNLDARLFLVSAYHPLPPHMPEGAQWVQMVKPLSYTSLEPYFG